MHTGALMAARQFLGHYLLYAKGWQRGLIAAGVVAGGVLLLATGNVCVQVIRARRAAGRAE
jgi:hypothetical protein